MPGRGRFITFEGGEGAGKSTQLALLAERLRAEGVQVVATREPGGTEGAEAVRALLVTGATDRWSPLAESLLHFAARADHLERVIRPALARGDWVLCDRFTDSSMAYQGYGLGLGRETVAALARLVVGETTPDLTLILDIPPGEGLARAEAAAPGGETRYERMGQAFHAALREAFRDIAAREAPRCALVDAARPREAVAADILALVRARLGPGGTDGHGA
ncbi:MAG: dTMP kinase [Alphaproteobacteria bacterium]|nr:dTMP kinase [Alphaproteobacteria bacterium]